MYIQELNHWDWTKMWLNECAFANQATKSNPAAQIIIPLVCWFGYFLPLISIDIIMLLDLFYLICVITLFDHPQKDVAVEKKRDRGREREKEEDEEEKGKRGNMSTEESWIGDKWHIFVRVVSCIIIHNTIIYPTVGNVKYL